MTKIIKITSIGDQHVGGLIYTGLSDGTWHKLDIDQAIYEVSDTLADMMIADGRADEWIFWDDLRVPAQNTKLNPTKSEPAFSSWIDGLFAYHFGAANNNDESIHFSAQLPHSYKEGSDLKCHVHWAPDSTNEGNVVWHLEYTVISINGTFTTTPELQVTDAADGTANKHQLTELGTISGTGLGISSMLVGRLTRLGDDENDTFTGNAVFLEIDFHYQLDAMGSRSESVK